jgi:single-strand selective monofunctional uracil DNA glycosylase
LTRSTPEYHATLDTVRNAGYFGIVQTGVPFGDVEMVRERLAIERPVERPKDEHPKLAAIGVR